MKKGVFNHQFAKKALNKTGGLVIGPMVGLTDATAVSLVLMLDAPLSFVLNGQTTRKEKLLALPMIIVMTGTLAPLLSMTTMVANPIKAGKYGVKAGLTNVPKHFEMGNIPKHTFFSMDESSRDARSQAATKDCFVPILRS